MNLTLFGATGATGLLLVDRALAAGHALTVYTRRQSAFEGAQRLRIVGGELDDHDAIRDAVRGADAVISLLGPKGASPGLPISRGMASIVAAMHEAGVDRLIATATPSAPDPRDGSSLPFRLAVLAVRIFLRSAYDDIVATADFVRNSGLRWTLYRLPMLSDAADGPLVGGYVGTPGIRLFSLSRASLARRLLESTERGTDIGEAYVLCSARSP